MTNSEKVCAIIEQEIGQKVTEETPLDELDCDSLEFLDLLLVLGEAFDKDVSRDNLKTVGDIVRRVCC